MRLKHRLQLTIIALLLLTLLLGAAYLRLYRLEYSFFGGDQSGVLAIAARFVNQGQIPLTANKSSAGILNPPLLEYLLAIPLFVEAGILGAAQFTALLNLAAVAACYAFVSRLFGWRAGLVATALFAFNPWAVYYSRLIWNPSPIPLFSTLLVGGLLAYFAGSRREVWLALSFLWLAAIIQLHLASLILILLLGLLFALFWRALKLRPILLGVLLFGLSFLPYLRFEWNAGFMDVRATLDALRGGEQVYVNTASALLARDLSSGHGIFGSAAQAGEIWRAAVWPWFGLTRLETGLLLLSLAYGLWVVVKGRRELFQPRAEGVSRPAACLILLLWLAFPVLMYLRHSVYLQNHYFLYLYPVPFVLIGLLVDDAWRYLNRPGPYRWARTPLAAAPLLLVGLITVWQFHVYQMRLDLTPQHRFDGRPLKQMDQLIATAERLMAARPECELVALSEGDSYEVSLVGLLTPFMLPREVRYAQVGRGVLVPRTCGLYLVTRAEPWTQTWLAEHANLLPQEDIQAGEETWRFYDLPAEASQAFRASAASQPPLGRWHNGPALHRATFAPQVRPGEALEISYIWQVTQAPTHPRYHFYNHLVGQSDGNLVAQEDGPGIYSLYWEAGDWLLTRFFVPVPSDAAPGTYQLKTGLYTWPELDGVPLDDGQAGLTVGTVQVVAPPSD